MAVGACPGTASIREDVANHMNDTQTPDTSRLMTTTEAARLLGVFDPRTVHNWAKVFGYVPIKTTGGRRKYREPDIQALKAWVERNKAAGRRGLPRIS